MSTPQSTPRRPRHFLGPESIAVIYCLLASTWIFASDHVVGLVAPGVAASQTLQTVKGIAFVLVTGALLYYLIREFARELRTSEMRYAQLFDNAGDMVYLHDQNGRIVKMNRAGLRMLGSPGRGAMPLSIHDIFPDGYSGIINESSTASDAGGGTTRETVLLDSRRNRIPVEINITHVHDEGCPGAVQGVVRDLTRRKAAEAEILKLNEELEIRVALRTQELEAANRELKAFSYSVSHDLRAPLRAISGFAQIIQTGHVESMDDDCRRYVRHIVTAAGQMERLIADLLDYSRMGRTALRKGPVDLASVFNRIREQHALTIEEKHAAVVVPASLPVIMSDQTRLEQVFSNLIGNALAYHRPEVPPRIDIRCACEGTSLAIEISDNGLGIPPEYHGKIFDVFQRLHSAPEHPGTGIGLAIVKKSVELLGGSVTVTSVVGEGSTFRVTLPLES